MKAPTLRIIDISRETAGITEAYANFSVASVNDHVVKASIMKGDFYWHYHPNSDETFLVMEGCLLIDLDKETIQLLPGQLFTIPKNVVHRTRAGDGRSVNLTFEHAAIETVKVDR